MALWSYAFRPLRRWRVSNVDPLLGKGRRGGCPISRLRGSEGTTSRVAGLGHNCKSKKHETSRKVASDLVHRLYDITQESSVAVLRISRRPLWISHTLVCRAHERPASTRRYNMEIAFTSYYNRYNESTCSFLLRTRNRKALTRVWQDSHALTSFGAPFTGSEPP